MTPEEKVKAALDDEVTVFFDFFGNDPYTAYSIRQTNPYCPLGWGATEEEAWGRAWEELKRIRSQNDPVAFGMTWDIARRLDMIWKEQGG